MRRVLAGALVALAATVAACGGGDNSSSSGSASSGGKPSGSITVWSLEKEPDRVKATQAIVDAFSQKTGVKVKLVAVDEDQLPTLVTSASAAGKLPDVMNITLGGAQTYAQQQILDPDAAQAVVDKLGADTFASGALKLAQADGKATFVPSDGWGQLVIYRKDLFEKAGLPAPDTLDKLQAAAQKLNSGSMAGITLATTPGDAFTEQSLEYLALADGCQLVDDQGNPQLESSQCVDALNRYAALAKSSVKGNQDVDSTRGTYFAGRAAMIIWSPFLLDAMAGLRNDAVPSCPQCKSDKAFLAKNSGLVGAISGPSGTPSQYGEITGWGITTDANKPAAQAFAEYMLSDGYTKWLAISPQGKYPVRPGTKSDPKQYAQAWNGLESGVDRKAPLSKFYSQSSIDALGKGVENFQRWGFPQGQGALIGALTQEQPVADAVVKVVNGTDAATAAKEADAKINEIKKSTE
jgi:multiple sugar transport system substrate-binding protein